MGSPNWVAGRSGNALEFTGSGTYVDCGNAEALNVDVFSVSFWCNIPSTQGWNHIVSRGSHRGGGNPGAVNWGVMMVNGEAIILFEAFNDTGWNGLRAPTTTGEWHHVVATYDGDTMQRRVEQPHRMEFGACTDSLGTGPGSVALEAQSSKSSSDSS